MTLHFPRLSALSLALAASAVLTAPAQAADRAKADTALPAVIQTLQERGLGDVQEFQASSDLRGFAGIASDQPVAIYVTKGGDAIVGTRVNAQGDSVDEKTLGELIAKPMSAQIWKQLDGADWFRDGKADAPRVVYAFMDANCPYCHKFYEAARPWVDAGKVQLRHILVGVIAPDSAAKAAAILSAKDPEAAMAHNEKNFDTGGIKPAPKITDDMAKNIAANQALMVELGFRGTPGILYKDKDGMVQRVNGFPPEAQLKAVLGPL